MSVPKQCQCCGTVLITSICSKCELDDRIAGEQAEARAKEFIAAKRELLKELIRQAGGHCV